MSNIIAIAERWARKPGRRGSHRLPRRPQPGRLASSRQPVAPVATSAAIQPQPLPYFTPAFRAALKRVSRDWRVNHEHLADTAIHFWSETCDEHLARERAKQTARQMTGLTQRDVGRLENAGYDYASGFKAGGATGMKLRHFDSTAREIVRVLPELALGDPDDPTANLCEPLWAILLEGRRRPPLQHDAKILDAAASYVLASGNTTECELPF